MKTLTFNDEDFKAEKIIKTDSDIIGYDSNDSEVFKFHIIGDFSKFSLAEGETYDTL